MTFLPPARVKSPVCEATILNFGIRLDDVGQTLGAIVGRSRAGGALQQDHVDVGRVGELLDHPVAAFLPSSMKSEPMKVT